MNQIYPDVGLVPALQRIATPSVHVHLYQNDVTPDRDTVLGDLTECAFTGYATRDVPVADFTLTGVVAHVGGIQALPVANTNASGGAVTVYGYFITDETDAILLAVARDDAAPVSVPVGDPYLVVPILGTYSSLSS